MCEDELHILWKQYYSFVFVCTLAHLSQVQSTHMNLAQVYARAQRRAKKNKQTKKTNETTRTAQKSSFISPTFLNK